jgi:hypothetical protein
MRVGLLTGSQTPYTALTNTEEPTVTPPATTTTTTLARKRLARLVGRSMALRDWRASVNGASVRRRLFLLVVRDDLVGDVARDLLIVVEGRRERAAPAGQ